MMDGFWAFLLWSAFCAGAGSSMGYFVKSTDLAKDCDTRNEMVISGRVYQCKAVALINNGVRAELK